MMRQRRALSARDAPDEANLRGVAVGAAVLVVVCVCGGAYQSSPRFICVTSKSEMAEDLRAQVQVALTCQPGEQSAALNGETHSVRPLAFFARKVPPPWLDEMLRADLYREHASMEADTAPCKGILSSHFHSWVASLVSAVDPSYEPAADHASRSLKARAIFKSLAEWAAERRKTKAAADDGDEVIEIDT